MIMKNVKAVAFDCDGVMFDTAQANRFYYSHILQHFSRPAVTDKQFAFVHMHTVDESMAYLFPDETTLAAAYEFRKSMDYKQYLGYFTIEPHLVSLLEKLRPQIKTTIATNRTDTMDRLLAEFNLDGYFDLVVTSSDVVRPKPHPEVLLKILNYFDLEPYQTIYIGDSQVDEMAARSAAIPLVAFRNRELSADYHIDTLKEVEELLNL
ncbi:Haloacid dehalogenase-like hydrolase [Olavius sp. associated proteobacterium Delta 1]|nr:Haloacid dehalogenase-like hydrolase [Olavius sp. associated proteobacterium Delta 1]